MSDGKMALPEYAFGENGSRPDLWPAEDSNLTYRQQNEAGRSRAAQLLDIIQRADAPHLLGLTIEAMVKKGSFGGLEVGFFHELSVHLAERPVHEFIQSGRETVQISRKMGVLRLVGSPMQELFSG